MNCIRCGSTKNIEKHHIIHRANGGSDEPDNMRYLCQGCHDYQHAIDNITEHIRKCNKKHQWARLRIWQYRLQVTEEFNKPELIIDRGYRSYWDDIKTHYMSREVKDFIALSQSVMKMVLFAFGCFFFYPTITLLGGVS